MDSLKLAYSIGHLRGTLDPCLKNPCITQMREKSVEDCLKITPKRLLTLRSDPSFNYVYSLSFGCSALGFYLACFMLELILKVEKTRLDKEHMQLFVRHRQDISRVRQYCIISSWDIKQTENDANRS